MRTPFPDGGCPVAHASHAHWRGQLDYCVFRGGQSGRVAGSVNGDAADIQTGALQATIRVDLTATDRGVPVEITPPAP